MPRCYENGTADEPLLGSRGNRLILFLPLPSFIAFEGPIASGKTTHASLLANRLGTTPLLEQFGVNEFLADYYDDRTRWALPMQLSFLALRSSQLRQVKNPIIETTVVDYSYLKDPAFAHLLLRDRELRLYEQIADAYRMAIAKHDVVVYLDARDEVLLERIRMRNRPYEASINAAYQDSLRSAYENAFLASPELTIIRYDTSDLDLGNSADVGRLQDTVLAALASR